MANLIVYYSRKGQNYWNGSIVDLAKGNTERVAEFVQKADHPSTNKTDKLMQQTKLQKNIP